MPSVSSVVSAFWLNDSRMPMPAGVGSWQAGGTVGQQVGGEAGAGQQAAQARSAVLPQHRPPHRPTAPPQQHAPTATPMVGVTGQATPNTLAQRPSRPRSPQPNNTPSNELARQLTHCDADGRRDGVGHAHEQALHHAQPAVHHRRADGKALQTVGGGGGGEGVSTRRWVEEGEGEGVRVSTRQWVEESVCVCVSTEKSEARVPSGQR